MIKKFVSDKLINFYEKKIKKLSKKIASKNDEIKKLNRLADINSIIASSLDKKRVLKTILEQTKKLVGCTKSSILLIDSETNQLVFEILTNEEEEKFLSDVRLNIGEGIAGSVWQNGKSLLISDAQNDGRFSKKADSKSEFITKSIMAVPLISNGKIIGVMEAINKENGDFFNSKDLRLFEHLSIQASVALDNANLYELAISDGKTKLYIHRYFQIRLEEELKRTARYGGDISLIMFDIDHFKNINDSYGHQMGDEILIKVASIIKNNCRTSDIPSRFGGEEFAVILVETTKEGASVYGEKIRKIVEDSLFLSNGKEVKITISAGFATYKESNPKNGIDFLSMADKALYFSKENGRNQINLYNDKMITK
ncbi:MAG TPA: sensor domain-containing diguanylate cyclase [Spirochaetota bacterium]|nr:sensor domain-containing diguanylate cyclase [Spirochaetota bacterium]